MTDEKYTNWRKSTRSSGGNDNCVEVAVDAHSVAMRDSKNRQGPLLEFGGAAWMAFIADVCAGQLDVP